MVLCGLGCFAPQWGVIGAESLNKTIPVLNQSRSQSPHCGHKSAPTVKLSDGSCVVFIPQRDKGSLRVFEGISICSHTSSSENIREEP